MPNAYRVRARQMAASARRRGKLIKQPCEICGSEEAVESHHAFGYAPEMALAVWWLCRAHHNGLHRPDKHGPVRTL